jgi:hypothetical protein
VTKQRGQVLPSPPSQRCTPRRSSGRQTTPPATPRWKLWSPT